MPLYYRDWPSVSCACQSSPYVVDGHGERERLRRILLNGGAGRVDAVDGWFNCQRLDQRMSQYIGVYEIT